LVFRLIWCRFFSEGFPPAHPKLPSAIDLLSSEKNLRGIILEDKARWLGLVRNPLDVFFGFQDRLL